MKSVQFPEQTVVIAKDQPQYNPLPAHVANGVVTSCWEPDAEDIKRLALYGKLYVSQVTFGEPLQPLAVQTVFDPPKLSQTIQHAQKEMEHRSEDPTNLVKFRKRIGTVGDMRGLGPQILFAMDTQTNPGKVICHFVRLETIEFNDDDTLNDTEVMTLNADADRRLPFLADCFVGGEKQWHKNLLATVKLCADTLDLVLKRVFIPKQLRPFIVKALSVAREAMDTYSKS